MSVFKGIVRVFSGVVKFVNGTNGNLATFATKLFMEIPALVSEIKKLIDMKANGLDDSEKYILVKSSLVEFDNVTGVGGLSFFNSLTDDEKIDEENALDHFKLLIWFIILKELNLEFVEYDSVEV